MKIKMDIKGVDKAVKNLGEVGKQVRSVFEEEMIRQGERLSERAKEILEQQSSLRTGKRYWTGKLQESIRSSVYKESDDVVGISVGPDMRTVPYSEFVEFGRFLPDGTWWEGYHYMEGAYAQLEQDIVDELRKTVRTEVRNYG